MRRTQGYAEDLAFIHDAGFSDFSLRAAKALPQIFRSFGLPDRRIVELGCGSGRLAAYLLRRGFSVTGIDASPAMIRLARQNVRRGSFLTGSLWQTPLPPCGAVISVGEVLNYEFDGPVPSPKLEDLFSRVCNALVPSGLFVFDILCSTNSRAVRTTRSFIEGRGWLVAVEKSESSRTIVRRIITFREKNGTYHRSLEIHRVRRHKLRDILKILRRTGFVVTVRSGYGRRPLGASHVVVIGKKPSST